MNQKGITIISLVITVIVLAVLAGVTIAMVTADNGMLTQTKEAKMKHKNAAIEEELELMRGEAANARLGGLTATAPTDVTGVIKRLVDKGIVDYNELEDKGSKTIGFKDASNTTTFSLEGIIE